MLTFTRRLRRPLLPRSPSTPTPRSTAPRVTVAVSTLNRRDLLEGTLLALQQLTYPSFEVVVVDGPSTDGTAEMLRSFEHSARLGTCDVAALGASRNIAVAMAAGDLVAFIDDDAIPPPDWLDLLVPAFEDSTVAAAGGPVFDVPLDRVEWKLCTCTRLGVPEVDNPGPIERYLGPGADPVAYFAGCNMIIRRTALQAVGGFNPLFTSAYDDADITRRLNDAGFRMAYVEQALVRHYRAASNVRDGTLMIRDPYRIIASRAVFALHGSMPLPAADVEAMMEAAADEWRNAAHCHLTDGRLTPEEHERFLQRVDDGVRDGLQAGRTPRPVAVIPDPPRHLFRQYN
jgi:hypothetical protein